MKKTWGFTVSHGLKRKGELNAKKTILGDVVVEIPTDSPSITALHEVVEILDDVFRYGGVCTIYDVSSVHQDVNL